MTLVEQKNIFLQTAKAKKAVAYARKWFDDFNISKLEPTFLQYVYAREKFNNTFPREAEKEFNDYELMFWVWWYSRYEREMIKAQTELDRIEAIKRVAELEADNPFNIVSNFLGSILENSKYIILGGLALLVYSKVKK